MDKYDNQRCALRNQCRKHEEEIESLRSRIKQLSTESDRLETEVRKAWKERDELKRRVRVAVQFIKRISDPYYRAAWGPPADFFEEEPEARSWIEEE